MAKFVRVGYGHDGRGVNKATGEGYVYLVNDNVRTKAVIQPVATHYISQKKFVTTGQVLHAYKTTSAKGQETEQDSPKKIEQALTRASPRLATSTFLIMYKFLCVSVNARDPADTRLNRKWQVF